MFLTGPRVVQRGARRGRLDGGARRPRGPRAKRRLPARRTDGRARRSPRRAACSLCCRRGSARRRPSPFPRPPSRTRPDAAVPPEARRVYDVRDVIAGDRRRGRRAGALRSAGRRNMVTVLARIDGRPVGVIANQPRRLGGVIDCEAAEKASRFVDRCDRFGLPLVVLVDTPGFMPGLAPGARRGDPPRRRRCCAPSPPPRVPKLTVVLRKAYGGAVITMNSQGPRRRPRLRLARRRDRDHGRRPGRRDRPPARRSRPPASRRRSCATSSRTPTPPST